MSGPKPPSGGRPPPQRTIIAPMPGSRAPGSATPAPGNPGQGIWALPDPGASRAGAGAEPPRPVAPPPVLPSGREVRAQPLPGVLQPGPPVGQMPPPGPALTGRPQTGGLDAAPQDPGAWLGQTSREQFFPPIGRPEQAAAPQLVAKIPLEQALEGRGLGRAGAENPLIGAGAGLLILFGRLRSRVVDMEAMPLLNHVTRELEEYERAATEAGADPGDTQVAKYVLCGTADDIVQNLPGTDREVWIQYAMEARFFHRRTSGVDVFRQIEAAIADPARRYHLLELMLTCLHLGFEGQYRSAPGGDVELQRWRRSIHEVLRRVRPREDDDISPRWQGESVPTRYQRRQVPVWVMAALVTALLGGVYLGLRIHLGDSAQALARDLRDLHPRVPLALVRAPLGDERADARAAAAFAAPPPPPVFDTPGKLERIQSALAQDIDAGRLTVGARGPFIVIGAGNELMNFPTGSANIRADIGAVVARIVAALAGEPGPIDVVGHTDSVPMSGRGRFRSNEELSLARAESVAAVLRPALDESAVLRVIGAGEDEPIAGNDTPAGQAQNRRVEIRVGLAEG